MQPEDVAKICHEANRAYCQSIGDYSQPEWADAPDWQRTSAINGVKVHLDELRDGGEALPEASHNAWYAEKEAAGWKYGPVKDPEKKEHPCFVEFAALPAEQQAKDYIFVGIVTACFRAGVLT